jgi:hypothetical protein
MRAGRRQAAWQGGGVPAGGWGTVGSGLWQRAGASRGPARSVAGLGTELIVPADGRRPTGMRDVTSIV